MSRLDRDGLNADIRKHKRNLYYLSGLTAVISAGIMTVVSTKVSCESNVLFPLLTIAFFILTLIILELNNRILLTRSLEALLDGYEYEMGDEKEHFFRKISAFIRIHFKEFSKHLKDKKYYDMLNLERDAHG